VQPWLQAASQLQGAAQEPQLSPGPQPGELQQPAPLPTPEPTPGAAASDATVSQPTQAAQRVVPAAAPLQVPPGLRWLPRLIVRVEPGLISQQQLPLNITVRWAMVAQRQQQ